MGEKSLDSELWHACAGGMVQMPPVNSKVFYFPQGHAEHTLATVDFGALPKIPPMILCRVDAVRYLADPETDEVYTKICLIPVGKNEQHSFDDGSAPGNTGSAPNEKPNSFAKTLTQSDANNGGGFSVPRYCAETIFPRLDYTADPPVQNVIAKDVHGETWNFRHIYRGTPRRHLLTTGWSTFVNQKKLVAGDSIVFLRAENGELCVGIRRAKRGNGANELSSGWNCGAVGNFGFSSFLKDEENKMMHRGFGGGSGGLREKGRVRPESVVEATFLAASGQPFEVVYYPRASTPEFCVKASTVSAAVRIQWCSGMRFKMPFETEDSSRISWFMGTIASVQVADPLRWPNSPWRLLQVTWDEPDLLQNVKCVNPWLVEMVSNMPVLHLSPFNPPRKKLRLPHHQDISPLDNQQFPLPSFSGNPLGPSSPLCCFSDSNLPAGIQGARHAQFGAPFSDLHLINNTLQMGLFSPNFQRLDSQVIVPNNLTRTKLDSNENISCLLSMGNYSQKKSGERAHCVKKPLFILFGQPILTEQQMSCDWSDDLVCKTENNTKASSGELGPDTGHCKVFLESEDVGRTLDLSVLGSYEELCQRLEHMFGIENSEMLSHVYYCDVMGAVKQVGDEPFSEFAKTAKRLSILIKPSNNGAERKLITGLPTAERGLDSSNQTGPLSIFA
ncbi:auxin response factor [Striga asiatica]|uniref:Auxin response factor n=1 Tax=Striga asiatica TaxID=4170 RepID=A0A5A7PMG8_STRAF|nr:auxin response factor [Striga asiatica]